MDPRLATKHDGYRAFDRSYVPKGGNYDKVAVSQRRTLRVPDPERALRSEYVNRISDSDLHCLSLLLKQGKIEVVMDRASRHVQVIPTPEVEPFIEQVLDSLPDGLLS